MTSQVLVNGRKIAVSVQRSGTGVTFFVDGQKRDASVVEVEPGVYHVLLDGMSFDVRTAADRYQVAGVEMTVAVEDPRALSPNRGSASAEGRCSVVSPMPGKLVRVLVAQGDAVERDQGLMVIEAMKMQNEIRSPRAGVVVSLSAVDGATVTANEVLAIVE